MLASTPLASDPAVRPPAWADRSYVAVAMVLVALALFLTQGHRLPVPGAFGEVDKPAGLVNHNEWLFLAAVVTTFWFVFGVAGRFAFSTASFVGLGAYVSHYATRGTDAPVVVGLAAAAGVAFVIAFAFAVLLRRAHHFYFAVATLGLAEVLLLVFRRWERLSGRSSGEITGVRDLSLMGWAVDSRFRSSLVLLAFLGLVLVLAALIRRSPVERLAVAARDKPAVAEAYGHDVERIGIVLFTVGSVLAAVAGSLFVHTRGLGTPDTFGLELGIGIFVALILGGLRSMWGGLVGSWFYVYVPLYLERWERWTQILWGAALVLVMITFPDGLVGVGARLRSLVRRRR